MDLNEYQQLAHKTSRFANVPLTSLHERRENITMAALGLCGEAGEVADHLKKWLYHDHDTNLNTLAYEIGDVLWYIAELCTALNMSLDVVAGINIAKLKERYGDAFSIEASIDRDRRDNLQ